MKKSRQLSVLTETLSPLLLTVLPSSVCPGFGVYALQRIPKDMIIGEYPGSLITDQADIVLRKLLKRWRRDKSSTDQDRIHKLKQYFNISLEPLLSFRRRRQEPEMIPPKSRHVNWSSVLDTIYGYSFQTDRGTLVPSRISYAGQPLYDPDQHEQASHCYGSLTPFINEAPPGQFKNLLTGRLQRPIYNVHCRVVQQQVIFYTQRTVSAGSELFFFYGPTYYRNYDINMLPRYCGWGSQDYEDADEDEKKLTLKFYIKQSQFKGLQTMMKSSPQRSLEMTINIKRLINPKSPSISIK